MAKDTNGHDVHARVMVLEKEVKNMKADITAIELSHTKIVDKIDDIKDRIGNRLPLWATIYITLLTSGIVGLGIYAISVKVKSGS